MIQKILISLLILLSGPSLAQTESSSGPTLIAWIAAKSGNKAFTNADVLGHVENVLLSDNQRSQIFQEAGKDWNRYKNTIKEYAFKDNAALYNYALKELVYSDIVMRESLSYQQRQSNASNSNSRNPLERVFGGSNNTQANSKRVAFNVTQSDLLEVMQDLESRYLQSDLDKRLGIVKARENFGRSLKENGFPHKKNETSENVYWRWYKSSEKRLQFEMLQNEVSKWEHYQATQKFGPLRIRPVEIHDFYKEVEKTVNTQLKNKSLHFEELQEFIDNNPQAMALIDQARAVSAQTMNMSTIIEDYKNEGQVNVEQMIDNLHNSFEAVVAQFDRAVLNYEERSTILHERYSYESSPQETLLNLALRFDQKQDDQDLMLARLYHLASYQDLTESSSEMRAVVRDILAENLPYMLDDIYGNLNSNLYLDDEYKNLLFYQVITRKFSKQRLDLLEEYKDSLEEKTYSYLSRSLFMAEFLLRTQAKNIASQMSLSIDANICEYRTFECQSKIKNWLESELYNQNLERYRNETLRERAFSLEITVSPEQRRLYGPDALEFLLN